ncbi:MAG: transposase [Rhodospirillales bacterium]|nr:transposase [Rhodospirillales bacterium]
MTDDRMALMDLLEMSGDTELLGDMLGFVADRLMAMETEGRCGATPRERSAERINHRNGYREQPARDRRVRGVAFRPATSLSCQPRSGLSSCEHHDATNPLDGVSLQSFVRPPFVERSHCPTPSC